ncbi:MAG: hypothetical protein R2764_16795 [Bacteroidales bacterium]
MDLQTKKLELVRLIINTKKPSILKKIEDIFKKEAGTNWYDELSKHEKQSIEKGLSEADKGELIPHEEVMQEIKAKYGLE